MNTYELSKIWFDFCFENTDIVTPNHTALYFFAIEHCNRLGWKDKFGFPMEMAKDAIGIKNYRTYSKAFEDIILWGFFKVYQRSKNQYSANVIGIVENAKPKSKALSKAMHKHSQKQVHGIVGVDKPSNLKPSNQELNIPTLSDFLIYAKTLKPYKPELDYSLEAKYNQWVGNGWKDGFDVEIKNWKTKIQNTIHRLVPQRKESEFKELKVDKI